MFLSIVVPVYNTEKYLRECLDSCLTQDIPAAEYEIICVDDGSTDSSPQIIDEYAARFPNVVAIHQANGGVSRARNAGLNIAQGDYIWFVDSDDLISHTALSSIHSLKQAHPDQIRVGIYVFTGDGNPFVQSLDANYPLLNMRVWSSIFCKAFLTHAQIIFREDLCYAEDALFTFEVSTHQPTSVQESIVCYGYRRHPESMMSMTPVKEEKSINSHIRLLQYVKDKYSSLHNKSYCKFTAAYFESTMNEILKTTNPKQSEWIAAINDLHIANAGIHFDIYGIYLWCLSICAKMVRCSLGKKIVLGILKIRKRLIK